MSAPAARFSTAHAMRIQKGVKGEIEIVEPDDPEMVSDLWPNYLKQN
jgi:hypothetical protein